MHLSAVRSELRGPPPFAPAYVSYTHRLQALVEDLRGCMTVADLAAVTGLSWDTVKNIIKNRLEKDYAINVLTLTKSGSMAFNTRALSIACSRCSALPPKPSR